MRQISERLRPRWRDGVEPEHLGSVVASYANVIAGTRYEGRGRNPHDKWSQQWLALKAADHRSDLHGALCSPQLVCVLVEHRY